MQVKDNGRGFAASGGGGHGLANMRARIQQIGGAFEFVSNPGAGTVITFRLNLE